MTAERHVEHQIVPGRRLGRRAPDPSKQLLKLKLTGAVPPHPVAVDHFSEITDWGVLGNDQFGDCGPAAVAHYVMLVTRYLTGQMVSPSLDDVLALYKLSNPDFDPNTGAGDSGVDMGQMLDFVCKQGIGGKVALAHATVDVSDLDALRAAVSIFGGLLYGVDLETAQQDQTSAGGPWDYHASPDWGGHAVLAGSYSSDPAMGHSDVSVVTWGEVMGTTDDFESRQLQEAHVLIFEEHLGTQAFQQGVDQQALADDYLALTDRPFPVTPPAPTPVPPVPPAPTPGPVVDDVDRALWATVQPALTHLSHHGAARTVHDAITAWHKSKGF